MKPCEVRHHTASQSDNNDDGDGDESVRVVSYLGGHSLLDKSLLLMLALEHRRRIPRRVLDAQRMSIARQRAGRRREHLGCCVRCRSHYNIDSSGDGFKRENRGGVKNRKG